MPDDIFAWLQGCPVLVTGASTVAVEAMQMDVPVVTVDLANELHGIDFIDSGATFHATSEEALENYILDTISESENVLLLKEKSNIFLKDQFHTLGHKATEITANAILDIENSKIFPRIL